ncbi:hypothetical protein PC121_g4592 [Phytophthora cactorum]|nr:hypothetical protein PC121_g4592 [Phytophthora cactorum]
MERMVVAAIQHLHIISVPDRYDVGALTNELILNSHVNTLLQPCSSRPLGTTALERKRSRQQLPHSSSQLFTPPRRTVILIQSGIIWRNCYLLAEIALDTIENNIVRDTQTQRRLIQDTNCDLIVSVFNSNSGHSSRRRLAPAITRSLLERLKTITHAYADDDITEQHIFARQLLAYLQLDVDLFGQEVVVFPALERPSPADGNSEQPEKQSDEGASPEEHEQELSPRTTRWEEENISEGDEDAGSDGYDVEGLDAASNADSLPYNTDEEEPAKTKASHISYTNQDDVDLNESLGDPKTHHPKDEETPENEATSDLRQWRQGRKIDGRFCLLQGASDDTTLSYSIAALGQLEALPTG